MSLSIEPYAIENKCHVIHVRSGYIFKYLKINRAVSV